MAKRILLFLFVNFLVISVITLIFYLIGFQGYDITETGIDYTGLMIFCLVWGMGGSFVSLSISRWSAKRMMGVQLVEGTTSDPRVNHLIQTVENLSRAAGLPMPEVGIYDSPEVNAFATGPSKKRSLVAVSSGLLQRMRPDEVEGVLGHELAHVANGDMVTMTLLQGVVNAFVMFLARVVAFAIDQFLRDRNEGQGLGFFAQYMLIMFFQSIFMMFGMIVIAGFSRHREFRADVGSAQLAGREKMISALQALKGTAELVEPKPERAVATLKIASPSGFMRLYATHPALDDRIARLQTFAG